MESVRSETNNHNFLPPITPRTGVQNNLRIISSIQSMRAFKKLDSQLGSDLH